jgi:hypothetical protein
MFVLVYTSILLVNGEEFSGKSFDFVFPRFIYIVPIVFNANAILSIMWLNVPNIGFLSEDILTQGLSVLLPLVNFLVVMAANVVVIYVSIYGNTDIHLYKMAAYLLGVIAVETSFAIYAFHISGVEGIRWILSLFHITFIGLTIWLYHRFKTKEIRIKATYSDLLLILLSVGIFTMVYIPFGIYNHFADNAAIVGNIVSLIKRGSLSPYYEVGRYYPAIGGFVSVVFGYLTGLDNILLLSNLPFLTASLMLPFVTYQFLKSFITDDLRIAVIGAIMASIMDGLALTLLPVYAGGLTNTIINWKISPATKSLYFSNISHLWLTPYKNFAYTSAVAASCMFYKRTKASLLLGSSLIFLSFINPRYSFLAVLLTIFLFALKKINAKELFFAFLLVLVFLGPLFPAILYKLSDEFLYMFHIENILGENATSLYINFLQTILDNTLLLTIASSIIGLVGITYLIYSRLSNDANTETFDSYSSLKDKKDSASALELEIRLSVKKERKIRFLVSYQEIGLLVASIALLIYIVLHAYGFLPDIVGRFIGSQFIAPLNYFLLRYHILTILILLTVFSIKWDRRMIITFAVLALLGYFGLISELRSHAPILIASIALPAFNSFVKSREKIGTFIVLLFVLLGVFSATFYSALPQSIKPDPIYEDLPQILNILSNRDPNYKVFSPASYHYYEIRIVRSMGNMQLTSDPSCHLYIIDKKYTKITYIDTLLNSKLFKTLYNGHRLILLEKK